MMYDEIKKLISDNQLLNHRRYTLREFYQIDDFLNQASEKEREDFYEDLSTLKRNRKLFETLRYLYVLLAYQREQNWQEDFQILLDEFDRHKKYDYLFHFLDRMLAIRTSGFLLKLLLKYQIKAELSEEVLLKTYEMLLKFDEHDYELVLKVAELKKVMKDTQGAIFYYKMAFYRCIEIKEIETIERILDELISLGERQESFYFSFLHNISIFSDPNFVARVYKKVFLLYFSDKKYIHAALDVLDEMIEREFVFASDFNVQDYLVQVIEIFYKDHKNMKDIVEFSRLTKPDINIKAQYKVFKQMIRYEKGRFVYHPNFGYGIIREVESPSSHSLEAVELSKIVIDFEEKKSHSMSLRIANKSVKILPRKHLLGAYLFNKESFQEISVTEEFIDRILLSLEKEKDLQSIKNLIEKISGAKADTIFKKVKEELSKGERYILKNKQYQINDDYSQNLLEQYRSQKDVSEKLRVARFILSNYPKSPIGSYLLSDFKSFLEEKKEMETILYGKYFQNRKISIDIDFQAHFNALYKEVDLDFFDRLENPFGRIYMDFIFLKEKNISLDLRKIFLEAKNEQRFYYFDLLLKKKDAQEEIREVFELVLKSANTPSSQDNYFHLISHLLKYGEKYPSFDPYIVYSSLIDKLDEYSKGEALESKRNYNRVKNLLFEQDFYDYVKKEERAKSLLQKLLQFHYLDDYLKTDLRELEVEIETGRKK